jgi:hypothetical protein
MREGDEVNIDPADSERGLYKKYWVTRTDGESRVDGRHFGCEYFVLDLSHDPHAAPARRAYAEACAGRFPALASDLRDAALRCERVTR